jgi:hypothetical protein
MLRDRMIGGALDLELARHQWDDGRRAVERLRPDRAAYDHLSVQVEIVTAEIARRVGQVFTLDELAAVYGGADRWVIEALQNALPDEVPAQASTVADAAFQLYSRRASDYAP